MLCFTLFTLGAAYLEAAPFAATPARAAATQGTVFLRGPETTRQMNFPTSPEFSRSSAATHDRTFDNVLFGSAAFALGSAAALAALRRPLSDSRVSTLSVTGRSRVGTVQMKGWDDPFSGNAFREGQPARSARPGRGKTAFDQEMQAQEDSYTQKLVIFSAVLFVGFAAFLAAQLIPYYAQQS